MTIERYNRALDKHTIRRLQHEDRAVMKMVKLLEQTRRELQAKLARLSDDKAYTRANVEATIYDINQVLGAARDRATGQIRDEINAAFEIGQRQAATEIAVFEAGYTVGALVPKISTDVLNIVLDERTTHMKNVFDRVREQFVNDLRRAAATNAANEASNSVQAQMFDVLAGEQAEAVKRRIASNMVQGKGTQAMINSLTNPKDGLFPRMTNRGALGTVRIAVNDSYNEARNETIRDAASKMPHIYRVWQAALKESTPICLNLHGQRRPVGEPFSHGGWNGDRPPAIGQNANPKFHYCRSVVLPWSDRWGTNPRFEPLTLEEKREFAAGDGFRDRDIVRTNSEFTRIQAPDSPTKPKPKPPVVAPAPKPEPAKPKPAKTEAPKPKAAETTRPETFADRFKAQAANNGKDEAGLQKSGKLILDEVENRTGPKRKALSQTVAEQSELYKKLREEEAAAKSIEDRMAIRAKQRTARDEWSKAEKELSALERKAALEVLKEIRPMGGKIRMGDGIEKNNRSVEKEIQTAAQFYPSDWVKTSNDAGIITGIRTKRGYYEHGSGIIAVSKDPGQDAGDLSRVAVHEIGHRMERLIPGIMPAQREFIKRRAVDIGEKPRPLAAKGEFAYVDSFVNHYVGKVYGGPYATQKNGSEAYEVITVGMETIFVNKSGFKPGDDHKTLILGMLGVL